MRGARSMNVRGLVLAASLLAACGGAGQSARPTGPTPTVPPSVLAAPVTQAVDGRTYTLEAALLRDTATPPAGATARICTDGTLMLRADTQSDPPAELRATTVWLIGGGTTWSAVPAPLQTLRADRTYHLQLGITCAPPFTVGTRVDAVLVFGAGSRAFTIASRGVEVAGR